MVAWVPMNFLKLEEPGTPFRFITDKIVRFMRIVVVASLPSLNVGVAFAKGLTKI